MNSKSSSPLTWFASIRDEQLAGDAVVVVALGSAHEEEIVTATSVVRVGTGAFGKGVVARAAIHQVAELASFDRVVPVLAPNLDAAVPSQPGEVPACHSGQVDVISSAAAVNE